MKQLLFAAALVFSIAAHAQSDKYMDAMKKNLSMYDSAKKGNDLENLSATFTRIGDAEKHNGCLIIGLPYH